jgi:hypothetical protein
MTVTKWGSAKTAVVKIGDYFIDWEKAPSKGQLAFQKFVFPYWKNDIVLAEMYIPGSKKRCDIVNVTKKIIVEYSPVSHHFTFNKFFHGNRAQFLKTLKTDMLKAEWAEMNGFQFLELVEKDIPLLSEEYIKQNFDISLW